ncbi:MAG: hypothetical protein H3C64_05275 [Candidatus Kuenenia stuttgartiensis]|nr:hypothetical protein [Candidatus Kuenenia stuttgartiensis]MBW7941811.1 hypothetical protein [Candidatus Kuenenia stuttgartiensis]MBZ0192663.1 hypothetical protein [Candidatus Kuenenia stuttgartiensis]MCZ7611788.1 hypothetical protein [Ignavibacterium sp.]
MGGMESYSLAKDSDEHGWACSEASLDELLPEEFRGIFFIAFESSILLYETEYLLSDLIGKKTYIYFAIHKYD